jgi:hypothetical protein
MGVSPEPRSLEFAAMRSIIRRCFVLAPTAIALALPLSAQAAAPEPGVTFDPGSPAGSEYAIPLSQGRADGAGSGDNTGSASQTPFGVGINPPGSGSGGTGGSGGSGTGHGHGGGTGATNVPGPTGGTGSRVDPTLRSRIAQAEEPGGTELWTLGIGLAVVLVAGVLALALRRGRPEQPA